MTIADKLTTIAENMPKVFEAGQQSMVDYSKIIPKTVSGSVISLDDVSEIPHEVSVQLSSDTVTDFSGVEVTVISENLFDAKKYPLIVGREIWALTGSVTYGGGSTICGTEVYVPCSSLRGKTITILHTTSIGANRGVAFYDDDKTYISGVLNDNGTKLTATIPDNATYYRFSMDAAYIDVAQIYEANNKKTYTAEANGTVSGVKSLSPYMTIMTDMQGVDITATYHKSWGMQTEYDRFWDAYQNNGTLTNYSFAFGGASVNDAWYNPKYPIIATSSTNMFRSCAITDTKVDIDVRGSNGTYVFNNAEKLVNVRKLMVDEVTVFTGWFAYCNNIEEIRIEGIIGNNFDIHWSKKLSMMSLDSIVGALSKTVTGQSITLPTTARDTYDSATIGGRWDELVAEYPNWSFKYS